MARLLDIQMNYMSVTPHTHARGKPQTHTPPITSPEAGGMGPCWAVPYTCQGSWTGVEYVLLLYVLSVVSSAGMVKRDAAAAASADADADGRPAEPEPEPPPAAAAISAPHCLPLPLPLPLLRALNELDSPPAATTGTAVIAVCSPHARGSARLHGSSHGTSTLAPTPATSAGGGTCVRPV